MKAETFDKIVEARANERAQAKISTFKDEVRAALVKLYSPNVNFSRGLGSVGIKALGVYGTHESTGWPSEIWDVEREAVTKEFLATMDEIQRALISAHQEPSPDWVIQEEKETP